MKKVFFLLLVAASFTACSDNGRKVEASKAQDVQVTKTEKTNAYQQISPDSHVNWRASHFGGMNPRFGKISLKSANITVDNQQIASASITMDMSKITVESFPAGSDQAKKLTGHLLSADFFDIGQYPTSKFELTKVEPATGKFNSKITGNLTIKSETKSITFLANVQVSDNQVSIQSEDFSVNRLDWGLKYNTEGTPGIPKNFIIANSIGFTIDVKLSK